VGLSEDELSSFDPTRFSDFLNRFADPPLQCDVSKFSVRGARFVVIEVPEFNDVPVICKADLNDARHRLVLKHGATYIRTERAASEIVSTAETMRDLIDRSIVKRGDSFLRMVDRVVASHPDKKALEDLKTAHQKAVAELSRSNDMVLEALGDALDMKDAESEGHSRRVTAYTIALARSMGIAREDIATIARGAFLHDMGKMGIPDGILRKPDQLTSDELSIMRTHPYRGYQLVKRIPFFATAAEIVYSHQERYDGTGYPRGLKGPEIPLGARVFAIADALDAMTSPRQYRPIRSLRAAREEIMRCSGSQFDPKIVQVFIEIPDRLWEDLRREIGGPTIN
jgi:HD-GYP domain-containing protein (c-di-GMP phosphodiesterase class II)